MFNIKIFLWFVSLFICLAILPLAFLIRSVVHLFTLCSFVYSPSISAFISSITDAINSKLRDKIIFSAEDNAEGEQQENFPVENDASEEEIPDSGEENLQRTFIRRMLN